MSTFAFPYCGGKYFQLKWLLSLLPSCKHFVEPFCGAATVALNYNQSTITTINDINGDVINFFKVLREQPEELVAQLELTPYSKAEYKLSKVATTNSLERARRFYVRVYQGFGSIMRETSGWGYAVATDHSMLTQKWIKKINNMSPLITRLKNIQIDNSPATENIKRFDTADTLFYCDPPYVLTSRVESKVFNDYEMSDDEHKELASVLHNVKGRVAISGHRCELYDELYGDWQRHDKDCFLSAGNKAKNESKRRIDSLWCNYAN